MTNTVSITVEGVDLGPIIQGATYGIIIGVLISIVVLAYIWWDYYRN